MPNNTHPFNVPASLRIALVTETWPPEVNGVALSCWHLAQRLDGKGITVQLVRPHQVADHGDGPTSPPVLEGGHQVLVPGLAIPFYPGLRLGLPVGRRLMDSWRDWQPQLVHIATEGPLGMAALWAARRLGLPVVSDYHTHFDLYGSAYGLPFAPLLARRWLKAFHDRCDTTIVPTRALARQLEDRGWPRVTVVGRGLDTGLFNPARRRRWLREIWGVAENAPVVLLVSRLSAEKNLELAIKAFERMHRADPRCRLVVVGDGPSRARLQALAPHAVFCGVRRGNELAAHYASADIFLFPSLSETYGNVIPEALGSGLAVVAFRHAAAQELVHHGVNGLLAEPGSPDSFIALAESLVRQPLLATGLRTQGPAAVADLDWDRIAGHQRTLYEQVLARRHSRVATTPATDDAWYRGPGDAVVHPVAPLGEPRGCADPA